MTPERRAVIRREAQTMLNSPGSSVWPARAIDLLAEVERLTAALTAVDQDAAEARMERDEAKARLRAAEAVCVMYGIQPAHLETEREKAAYEVWLMWAALVDPGATTSHPDLTNERIAELARQRDEKRAKALDGIQKLTREL